MYGMYGKNGSGGIPSKYRTLSDIPYTDKVIFRAVRRREMTAWGSPEGTAGTRTLEQSLVCYTHHDGGREKLRTGRSQTVILTGPKKKNDR